MFRMSCHRKIVLEKDFHISLVIITICIVSITESEQKSIGTYLLLLRVQLARKRPPQKQQPQEKLSREQRTGGAAASVTAAIEGAATAAKVM